MNVSASNAVDAQVSWETFMPACQIYVGTKYFFCILDTEYAIKFRIYVNNGLCS